MKHKKLGWKTRFLKWVQINKIVRMNKHYLAIKPEVKPQGEKQKQEVRFFCSRFEHYHKKSMRLIRIRYFFYAILYAGLLVNVIKLIPFLSIFAGFIEFGGAIFGTTVAFIGVYVIGKQVDLNAELMNECLTHLIFYYHKNAKRDTGKALKKIAKTI